MTTPQIRMDTELCQRSRHPQSLRCLLVLVQWSLAAPLLVNLDLLGKSDVALYTKGQSRMGEVLVKEFFCESKAEYEQVEGAWRCHVTRRAKFSNAELQKKAKPEGFGLYDQVTKRTRWMPWRQKAMKDV